MGLCARVGRGCLQARYGTVLRCTLNHATSLKFEVRPEENPPSIQQGRTPIQSRGPIFSLLLTILGPLYPTCFQDLYTNLGIQQHDPITQPEASDDASISRSAIPENMFIVRFKQIEYGVYGDLVIIYTRPDSIY